MTHINGSVYPPPAKATSNGVFQGDNPLDFALPVAILQMCLVVVTCGLAFLHNSLKQPSVIAEIIASTSHLYNMLSTSKAAQCHCCLRGWIRKIAVCKCHTKNVGIR